MTALLSNLLTNSRLKCARQCARLHQYKYILGYRPTEDAAALAFGTLIHKALEAWWLAVKTGFEPSVWFDQALLALGDANVDPYDLIRAHVMISGYHTRWADDAALYSVLGAEEVFEFPLVNPETGRHSPLWKVGGKLDVRVRRKSDGALGIIEHKTTSSNASPGSFYWARLKLDSQISTYMDGAASLTNGEMPALCIYDVLLKPALRPLKATPLEARKLTAKGLPCANQRTEDETPAEYGMRCLEAITAEPDRYFIRGEVVRLESELEEARAEVWQQAAALRENINAGRHARDVDQCDAFGRICPFFPVCVGEASLDDERLFRKLENVHPELEAAK